MQFIPGTSSLQNVKLILHEFLSKYKYQFTAGTTTKMTTSEELNAILNRIVKNQQTETDVTALRQWLSGGDKIFLSEGNMQSIWEKDRKFTLVTKFTKVQMQK